MTEQADYLKDPAAWFLDREDMFEWLGSPDEFIAQQETLPPRDKTGQLG